MDLLKASPGWPRPVTAASRGKTRGENTRGEKTRPEAFRPLPEDHPLHMPVQDLSARPERQAPPFPDHTEDAVPRAAGHRMGLRRAFVFAVALALTVFGIHETYLALSVNGLTALEAAVLGLFAVLFGWIALSFANAIAGLISIVSGGGTLAEVAALPSPVPPLSSRTAILIPTYNEAPDRVFATVLATRDALAETGQEAAFDIFVLSDTTDCAIWIAEETAFLAARRLAAERHGGREVGLYYRRRRENTERKAGNVAEWVRRFGGGYDHMLVFDADSLMSGETIVALAAAMERRPDAGLIQTLPVLVEGRTLLARAQQFAGGLYGPMIAHGIAWWHGTEGNYWGHNAIIRTQAFARAAGLPKLPGRKPLGGDILSHDFVEAALMRRRGWAVVMVPAVSGSYEEGPPTVVDAAVRDRRWCQGNLQHGRLFGARGLHWLSRLHFGMGIASYVAAPLWLMFLVAGVLLALQARFVRPDYFPQGFTLFPVWPQIDPVRSLGVFLGTLAVLLAPKLMSLAVALAVPSVRRRFGGGLRLAAGFLTETMLMALVAPLMMLFQSRAVAEVLAGRDSGWNPQRREDGGESFGTIFRTFLPHTLLGLVFAAVALAVSPPLFWWMSPVIFGLVGAAPVAAAAGSRRAGAGLARVGLLATPEEREPPDIVVRARRAAEHLRTAMAAGAAAASPGDNPVRVLLSEPALLAAHCAMLERDRPAADPAHDVFDGTLTVALGKIGLARDMTTALDGLDVREQRAVLGDADTLRMLAHRLVAGPRSGTPAG